MNINTIKKLFIAINTNTKKKISNFEKSKIFNTKNRKNPLKNNISLAPVVYKIEKKEPNHFVKRTINILSRQYIRSNNFLQRTE